VWRYAGGSGCQERLAATKSSRYLIVTLVLLAHMPMLTRTLLCEHARIGAMTTLMSRFRRCEWMLQVGARMRDAIQAIQGPCLNPSSSRSCACHRHHFLARPLNDVVALLSQASRAYPRDAMRNGVTTGLHSRSRSEIFSSKPRFRLAYRSSTCQWWNSS
jgi:hypothetical protein